MKEHTKAVILIVDDNAGNLLSLRAVLEAPNYEIVEASSGREAIALSSRREFALLVLDVSMPEIDGFDTARAIKTGPKNTDTPIIFVSAIFRENPFVKKGYEIGAVDYFGKPFDPEVLRAKVAIYTDLYLKTKRLEETEDLLTTHAQIKTLLEAIPVGMIVCDSTGKIYESNLEARRIWGGIREVDLPEYNQYKGRWAESGAPIESHEWAMARALVAGEIIKEEKIEIEAFDGKKRLIVNSAYPIRGKDRRILGAVAILQDITGRQKLDKEIDLRSTQLLRGVRELKKPSPNPP